jgi:hypothetical protein
MYGALFGRFTFWLPIFAAFARLAAASPGTRRPATSSNEKNPHRAVTAVSMDLLDECRLLRQVLNLLSEQVIVRDAYNNVVFQNAASQAAEREPGGAFITVVDTDIVGPTSTLHPGTGVAVAGVATGFGGASVTPPSEGAAAPAAPDSPLRLIVRSPAGAESPVVRAVLNALPHCAYLVKPTGHTEFINMRLQSALNMSLDEAEAADWCMHPDDAQRVRDS